VLNGVALHDGEGGGGAHSVVGAECRAVGLQPVAIQHQANGVGVEIVRRAFILLADHIQVTLQGCGNRVLPSGTRRLAHHDVSHVVVNGLESQAGGAVEHVCARGSFFRGRARDRGQRRKVREHGLRFQVVDYGGHRLNQKCYRMAGACGATPGAELTSSWFWRIITLNRSTKPAGFSPPSPGSRHRLEGVRSSP